MNIHQSYWPEGLQALWYDAKGNWNASHDIAQDMPSDSWFLDTCISASQGGRSIQCRLLVQKGKQAISESYLGGRIQNFSRICYKQLSI